MHAPTSRTAALAALTGSLPALLRHLPRLALDALLIGAAFGLALFLRFDGAVPGPYLGRIFPALPAIVALYVLALRAFGIHEHLWQFAGVVESLRLWGAI